MAQVTEHVYTPSELNREVRLHMEMGFPRLLLEGEISNLSRPASGHLYFTLKDDKAQVRCALFRSAAVRSRESLENGRQVLARGRISLYEPRGDYQMIVEQVQEAGEGILQRQFEELKRKLDKEGLFDPSLKRPVPAYPQRIAVLTSPRGAAVRDILHVLERRWPLAAVRLYPILVQGPEAPAQICSAIEAANRHAWAEVLILGRGGGSLEDLAAFNQEAVARAIRASEIPLISAVGHETDFSICDFVADLRAPTPSAAAELATPDQAVLREAFRRNSRQLTARMRDRLQRDSQRSDHLAHRLQRCHPSIRLSDQSQRLWRLSEALQRAMHQAQRMRRLRLENSSRRLAAHRPDRQLAVMDQRLDSARRTLTRVGLNAVRTRREKLRELARTLQAVSPLDVIARGYAVVTLRDSGTVISSATQVTPGDRIEAQLSDGKLGCLVESLQQTP